MVHDCIEAYYNVERMTIEVYDYVKLTNSPFKLMIGRLADALLVLYAAAHRQRAKFTIHLGRICEKLIIILLK